MSSNKQLKELHANKQREQALKHLEQHGQSINSKGIDLINNRDKRSRGDNTLDILLRQKAQAIANSNNLTLTAKNQEISNNKVNGNNDSDDGVMLPWRGVKDSSGKLYYWNTITSETTWIKPSNNSSSNKNTVKVTAVANNSNKLPLGWEEKIHPATKQTYFINSDTGEISDTRPVLKEKVASSSKESPWLEVKDNSTGKVYYWNTVTNKTTWTNPSCTADSSVGTKESIAANDNESAPQDKKRSISSNSQLYSNAKRRLD